MKIYKINVSNKKNAKINFIIKKYKAKNDKYKKFKMLVY